MIPNNFNIRNQYKEGLNNDILDNFDKKIVEVIELCKKIASLSDSHVNKKSLENALKNIETLNSMKIKETLLKLSGKSNESNSSLTRQSTFNNNSSSSQEEQSPRDISKKILQIFKNQEIKQQKKNEINVKTQKFKNYELDPKMIEDSLALRIDNNTNYYPIKLLGTGGFANVYLCNSKIIGDDNKYALKIIGSNQHKKHKEKELKANIKLKNCQFIASFQESLHVEGNLVLVLEYCDNGTLKEFMSNYNDGLPELLLFVIFSQIVKGLNEIHQHKIIHRDIKPANIGITKKYDIKIFDFTTAKFFEEENEITHGCGSRNFMDPQYLFNQNKIPKDAWKKLDTFSLGIVLYYLTYGKEPYKLKSYNDFDDFSSLLTNINWEFTTNKVINPDLKNLIENLITIDNQKRYDLNKVITNSWYKKCDEKVKETRNKYPQQLNDNEKLFKYINIKKII